MKFIGQLLASHLQRYPRMGLEDIYKLLHQAAMGPGHSITDDHQARNALGEEYARMGEGPADPSVDPISPDGRLARIHLRSYLAEGRDVDALADALLRTAREVPPAKERLARFCACLGDLAEARGIPFPRSQVDAFVDDIRGRDYPVVRHSATYRDAYRPAYRVIGVDFLP